MTRMQITNGLEQAGILVCVRVTCRMLNKMACFIDDVAEYDSDSDCYTDNAISKR